MKISPKEAFLELRSFRSRLKISNAETFPIDANVADYRLQFRAPPEGDGFEFHLLHVEFYQEVNGDLYSLKNGSYNSLSILEVTDAPEAPAGEEGGGEV